MLILFLRFVHQINDSKWKFNKNKKYTHCLIKRGTFYLAKRVDGSWQETIGAARPDELSSASSASQSASGDQQVHPGTDPNVARSSTKCKLNTSV